MGAPPRDAGTNREFSHDSTAAAGKPVSGTASRISGSRARPSTPIVSSVITTAPWRVSPARCGYSGAGASSTLAATCSRQLKSGLTMPCVCNASRP